MRRSKFILVGTALAALVAATPALADPITFDADDVGTTFTLNYNGFSGGTMVDGLTASTTFTLTGVTGTSYTFDYTVNNTTGSGVESRISSFAFDTDAQIATASSTGTYNDALTGSSYPNGIGSVDVCFKAGGSNSCAGGNGGVTTGDIGSGSLTLGFAQPITSLTLDNFFVRYQSVSGAGPISSGNGAVITSSGGTPVPEPEMLVLFGLGAAALAFRSRRRQAATGAAGAPALAYA
ncbi:cistern family PEP-CTERM protein [Altererythrobacter aerius]|uniref:Cistern family PEP-CTERM protein n=1 Tax=Tsuneonella aeria TaxID=1837929 RepID=A0A6I4TAQ3_9SPHN|nr:cistern family PEP-CTERM protein [Tsuneonella aeria]MXO73834.1 cistern family PEP-CTERM protein [Tsuneonella aeria]